MTPPLEIRITAKKSRVIAGEGITLAIAHRVNADLQMETVDLNRSRTTITIVSSGETTRLTGSDYAALHRVHPLKPIGIAFKAPAGSAWTSDLNLLKYTRPLPAGRYRLSITYRYGTSDGETVASNTVDVEVVPATLLTNDLHWFGETGSRDILGSLWTALDGDRPQWMFQTSSSKDPGAILTSVDLALPNPPRNVAPRLAHLNDIGSMHFERYVVWVDGAKLWWMTVAPQGRISEPASVDHGAGAAAKLSDPPLQLREGGFKAVVGPRLIQVSSDGSASSRNWQQSPLVLWDENDEPRALEPESSEGTVIATVLDQWMGRGALHTAIQEEQAIETSIQKLPEEAAEEEREPFVIYLDRLPNGFIRGELIDAASLADGRGLALLFASDAGWAVITPDRNFRIPTRGGANPRLVAPPGGLFVMEHSSEQGFIVTRLGEAPLTDPI